MVLVDSSVWIDHLRFADPRMERLLLAGDVMGHPFVVGEIAMGNPRNRAEILEDLDGFPMAIAATDEEARHLIETQKMFGKGISYIDAHLLASVRLTLGTVLWTRDKRLHEVALALSLAFQEARPN